MKLTTSIASAFVISVAHAQVTCDSMSPSVCKKASRLLGAGCTWSNRDNQCMSKSEFCVSLNEVACASTWGQKRGCEWSESTCGAGEVEAPVVVEVDCRDFDGKKKKCGKFADDGCAWNNTFKACCDSDDMAGSCPEIVSPDCSAATKKQCKYFETEGICDFTWVRGGSFTCTDFVTEAPVTEAPTTEADYDDCGIIPCFNGASCVDGDDSYTCVCLDGFGGDDCEIVLTTAPPTTEAPTTRAPTTQALTTQAPTTQAPTTEAPTIDTQEGCYWTGGDSGDFVKCEDGEAMRGACGSGSDNSCSDSGDSFQQEIYCCPLSTVRLIADRNREVSPVEFLRAHGICTWNDPPSGSLASCERNRWDDGYEQTPLVVVGVCGSSSTEVCEKYDLDSYYNISENIELFTYDFETSWVLEAKMDLSDYSFYEENYSYDADGLMATFDKLTFMTRCCSHENVVIGPDTQLVRSDNEGERIYCPADHVVVEYCSSKAENECVDDENDDAALVSLKCAPYEVTE